MPGRTRGSTLERGSRRPRTPAAALRPLAALGSRHGRELLSRHLSDGRFLEVSAACRRVLGHPRRRLLGRTLADLVAAEYREPVAVAFREVARGRGPRAVVYRLAAAGGEAWCETVLHRLPPGEAGAEVGAVTRDVTAAKKLERILEAVANEWRAAVDAAQDVIVVLDRRFRVMRANRATPRFLGLDFPDILRRDPRRLFGGDARRPLFDFAALARDGAHVEEEVYLPRRRTWVRYSLDPVRDARGKLAGAVLVLRDIGERRRAERQLRASLAQLRQLSSHLQVVREEERALISREIHDELGHAMTALKMEVVFLASRLPDGLDDLVARARSIAGLIDQTIATIRRIATELRPGVLDDLGLAAAIEWQAEEFARRTGIATRVGALPAGLDLPPDRASAVFRIFQESLTNVARHAEATLVTVALERRRDQLVLRVHDDGRGLRPREATGRRSLGLLGMKERAAVFGGSVHVAGAPGKGTTVTVRVPLTTPGDRA